MRMNRETNKSRVFSASLMEYRAGDRGPLLKVTVYGKI